MTQLLKSKKMDYYFKSFWIMFLEDNYPKNFNNGKLNINKNFSVDSKFIKSYIVYNKFTEDLNIRLKEFYCFKNIFVKTKAFIVLEFLKTLDENYIFDMFDFENKFSEFKKTSFYRKLKKESIFIGYRYKGNPFKDNTIKDKIIL